MPNRPSEIQCPHYAPAPGSRTCVSFVSGGGCVRPDTFMCTEYVRKNPARGVSTPPTTPMTPPVTATVSKDLFGDVVRAEERPKAAPLPPRTSVATTSQTGAQAFTRPTTEEQINALEERRVELCVRTEATGEVWLVPAYTGAERNEVTFRDAATIAAVCAVFPGAEVTRFERRRQERS